MARLVLIGLLSAAALSAGTPAFAQFQFPNIFDQLFRPEPPPRPPSDLGRPPPPPGARPQQGLPPGPPPGRIQQQSLPPPPGSPRAPQSGQPQQQDVGIPPGQRGPRPTVPNAPPQPADTAPQPGDEVIMEPPTQKIVNPTAVFSGLDKITGRIISFEVAINETVRFGALEVTPRVCYTRPPTLAPNTDAFIEVDELTLQGELRRIFTGWMFVASPGLNAIEHPIYDVWLTDCKGGGPPPVTAEAPPEPTPAAQQPAPRQPRQPQQQPRRVTPQPPSQASPSQVQQQPAPLPPPPFR